MKPLHAGKKVRVSTTRGTWLADGYLVMDSGGLWPYNHKPYKGNLPRLRATRNKDNWVFPILTLWPDEKIEVIK